MKIRVCCIRVYIPCNYHSSSCADSADVHNAFCLNNGKIVQVCHFMNCCLCITNIRHLCYLWDKVCGIIKRCLRHHFLKKKKEEYSHYRYFSWFEDRYWVELVPVRRRHVSSYVVTSQGEVRKEFAICLAQE